MQKASFNPKCKYKLEVVTANIATESSEPVYNIEIPQDHSYLVNGIVVKNCRCRYFRIHPEHQYVDTDGTVKLKAMDPKAWEKWNKAKIKPIEEQMIKYGIAK